MKFWLQAIAAAAVAAAGVYAVKRLFSPRSKSKEVPWSTILPAPLTENNLLQKLPYRMMSPLFWVGKE
jgi:hypothetical protein